MLVKQNSRSRVGQIAKRKYGSDVPLLAGEDSVVKEEGGANWLPFPDVSASAKIRHKLILVRNERPKIPSFCKAPMPDKRNRDEERNARIVMAYVHSFTLQESVVDELIPHASRMRRGCESWTAAPTTWLNGEVLTHESQHYIQNVLCVAQMRPEFILDANKNDEDLFSDEELDMETVELDALLRTHVGSAREVGTDATTNEADGVADEKEKQDAMNKSDEY